MTVDVKAADGVTTQSYVVDLTMYDGSDGADFSSLTYTTASKAVAVDLNEYTQYITVDHADKTISFNGYSETPGEPVPDHRQREWRIGRSLIGDAFKSWS
jgi:hypothetical protein